jgi:sugar phosphate isomerase/epimerase
VPGVAKAMKELGLQHVHLGIRGAVEDSSGQQLDTIRAQRWTITSTMIDFPQEDYSTLDSIKRTGGVVPDDSWQRNRDLFIGAAEVTADLNVKYLSMHAGFIDEKNKEYAKKMSTRIRELADIADDKGIILLLETGQESAPELQHFLEELDHDSIGVNFDPANMILYDKGDPIEAVRVLSPWVEHLHVKDAVRTSKPGTWGSEVPWGDGQVGVKRFIDVLKEVEFEGAMAIEREAGDDRAGDIKLAIQRLAAACK